MRTLAFILATLALGLTAVVLADSGGPQSSSATYNVKVAGFVKGTGVATFSGSTLSITVSVVDENGNKGTFSASGLTLDAKSHFRGSGTVLGKSMKISGRLDNPQTADKQLKTRRLVASFETPDALYGRVAGFVPVGATHKSGDDDD